MAREGFGSNPERSANRPEVEAAVSGVTRGFGTAALIEVLQEAGVPCSAVNSVPDMIDDPQVKALGLIEPMAHPDVEGFEIVNLPITFDGSYPEHQSAPPRLGADTDAVLLELGLDDEMVAVLRADGVVGSAR